MNAPGYREFFEAMIQRVPRLLPYTISGAMDTSNEVYLTILKCAAAVADELLCKFDLEQYQKERQDAPAFLRSLCWALVPYRQDSKLGPFYTMLCEYLGEECKTQK